MVRKFICSFVILSSSNNYSKDKIENADLNMSFHDFVIESPLDWILKYEFKIKEAFANSDGYGRANSLIGFINYLKFTANYKTNFLKIKDISSEYNMFQIIAYNNELKNDDFEILFEKLQVLYDVHKPYETILTIYPNYSMKYHDFYFNGERSIKLRGKNLSIHGLNLRGPFNLSAEMNEIKANFEEKTFFTESINFAFLEDGSGSIKSIESKDIESSFQIFNIIVQKDCNIIKVKEASLDLKTKIISIPFMQILLSENILLELNNCFLYLDNLNLFCEDINIIIENQNFAYVKKGCIDLKNYKLYLYDGEINV